MELVALLTVMRMKVLESVPSSGSITLQDLAKAIEAQESMISVRSSQHRRNSRETDCSILERLLRLLVAIRFLNQAPDGRYSHFQYSPWPLQ